MGIREDAEALHDSLFRYSYGDLKGRSVLDDSCEYAEDERGFYDDLWAPDAGRIARLVRYVLSLEPTAPTDVDGGS